MRAALSGAGVCRHRSLTAHANGARGRRAGPGRPGPAPAAHGHAGHAHAHETPNVAKGIAGVKSIIAVASGKGGVGKSTVAVNLALGLSALGLKTGLLDADIYGPSVPRLLAIKDKPRSDGKTLHPIERFGLKAMSIGFLVNEDTPMIWRGPMVMSALTQMLVDVAWEPLDVLVVASARHRRRTTDLSRQAGRSKARSSFRDAGLGAHDARKGLAMFFKTTAVPVPASSKTENVSFVRIAARRVTSSVTAGPRNRGTARSRFLGEIPLVMSIRETSDAGTTIVAKAPGSPSARVYRAGRARPGQAV